MPYKPNTPCKHPDCAKLVPSGEKYCAEHKPLHPEYTRSAGGRGYDSKWRSESKAYLREHPLCVECMKRGKYTQAAVVDHIVPHRGDSKQFWDRNNWQPLCKPCHDRKTGRDDSRPTYGY